MQCLLQFASAGFTAWQMPFPIAGKHAPADALQIRIATIAMQVWARDYSVEDPGRCDCDGLQEALGMIQGARRMVRTFCPGCLGRAYFGVCSKADLHIFSSWFWNVAACR